MVMSTIGYNSDQPAYNSNILDIMQFYLVLAAAAVKEMEAFSLTMQTFIPPPLKYNPSISSRVSIQLATTASATATLDEKAVDTPQQTKTLGLLTFDLGEFIILCICAQT